MANKEEELREKLEAFNSQGCHACYCVRSTDGGCTCDMNDGYVNKIIQFIKQETAKAELRGLKHGLITGAMPETVGKPFAESYIKRLEKQLKEENQDDC